MICFFADHGDHLGDHHGWQKESFFEQSCHIPFLVSWPAKLPAGQFELSWHATRTFSESLPERPAIRNCARGSTCLALQTGTPQERSDLLGYYGNPGSHSSR